PHASSPTKPRFGGSLAPAEPSHSKWFGPSQTYLKLETGNPEFGIIRSWTRSQIIHHFSTFFITPSQSTSNRPSIAFGMTDAQWRCRCENKHPQPGEPAQQQHVKRYHSFPKRRQRGSHKNRVKR